MTQNSNNRSFASDNNSGVSPAVMNALSACNSGHVVGYGDDPWTHQAQETIQTLVGKKADVFFTYGGTGANVLALASATPSFGAIICASTAHINVDECGAPEKFSGAKLLPIPTEEGKLTPERLNGLLHAVGDQHHSQPRVVSISQPTELGTLYSLEELEEMAAWVKENQLHLHIDGARIANACIALNCDLSDVVKASNCDLMSFGGTKNGLMFGEAIVSFRPECSRRLKFLRKQGMQLHSKMRYIGAQFQAMYGTDLWKQNARHANGMAKRLKTAIEPFELVNTAYKVETNAVFVSLPKACIEPLQERRFFYVWDSEKGIVRWMTSFDTQAEDIESFVADLAEILKRYANEKR